MMAAGVLVMAWLAASPQTAVADRARAEGLDGDGRTAEAMQIFERIVADNPADVEARLWIGRLDLRLGRAGEAEAVFRAVLADHPADVDARIGLGSALLRRNAWQDALTVLHGAERDAGENADLFATLARAYRRAGDDRLALDYFRRARARSPDDPDIVAGYEDVARAYGHGITLEGFGQWVEPGSDSGVGTFAARLRVAPRLHLHGEARVQSGEGYSDTLAGGGVEWRAGRATILSLNVVGGSGNVALANTDVFADAIHYAGSFELGASVREISFAGADVTAVSPVLAWDTGGRWRLEGRSATHARGSARQARERRSLGPGAPVAPVAPDRAQRIMLWHRSRISPRIGSPPSAAARRPPA